MKQFVWLAALLSLIGGLGFVLWSVRSSGRAAPVSSEQATPDAQSGRGSATVPLQEARPPGDAAGEGSPAPSSPDSTPRKRLSLEPLSGLLRDKEGTPLSGALLTWSPLLAEFEGIEFLRDLDLDRLRVVTVSTASEGGGRFRFPELPPNALEVESVVWITVPGREAAFVLLERPSETGWSWSGELTELRERAACGASVRRAGEPVPGARIVHTLSFWDDLSKAERRARRVFLRELESGLDGRSPLVPGPGENTAQAFLGPEQSLLWVGKPETELTLELLPTFEVSGVVLTDPPDELGGARYHVGFHSQPDRSDFVWAAGGRAVREDGGFGPDTWPRPEHTTLVVRAAMGDIIPAMASVPLPEAGGQAFVELTTRIGLRLLVEVVDPSGAPLSGAHVDPAQWTGAEWLSLSRQYSDEAGALTLRGLPTGQLELTIGKSGFTSQFVADARVLLPRQETGPLRVTLRPAGVVAGRVTRAGEAVPKFTLVGWSSDRSYDLERALEDERGEFRLEDVPRGEVLHLFAFSEELPQSETVTVVPASEAVTVTLELPAPRRARGRVIDSLTGEPLASATIQHLTTGKTGLAGYRGRVMTVERDGSFELEGFFPARGGFTVMAEGYETLFYYTREDDSEVIDVGLLAMNPLCTLDISVREPGVSDFSAYHAWNARHDDRTPRPLASAGTLRLISRSGPYIACLLRPDGSVATQEGVVLPGATERVEFESARGVELAVVLDVPEGPPRGIEGWRLKGFSSAGERAHHAEARWSGELQAFVLRGLDPGSAVLELRDADGELLVQRSLELTSDPVQSTTLRLDGSKRRLRLVDERGDPWAAKRVSISLENGSSWYATHDTDAAGELEIGPLSETRVVLSARLGNEFIAYGIPVALEPDPTRATVVTIANGERSYLRLVEAGTPCSGVGVAYYHALGTRNIEFGYASDEKGEIKGPICAAGSYLVRIHHQRYWPTLYTVEGRGPSRPAVLELYSLGALEFTVEDQGARPLAGATLELEHAQLGETAAEWLARDEITAGAGLRSDTHGRFVLERIPRGTYSWTWIAPSGERASGKTALGVRENASVKVRIDVR